MKGYATSKVDLFLWNYISKINLPHYAVEFGALDGKRNSNIRLFLERGWKGLWIEPTKENFAKLKKNIKGLDVEILNIAIADFEGEETFYYHDNHPGGSSLIHHTKRTFHPSNAPRYNDRISYKVKCLRLETVMKDRPKIGLVTIDAEDMDTRIVKDLIESNVRPIIVMSEGRDKEAIKEQERLMGAEYDLVKVHGGNNSIFRLRGTK